MSEQGPAERPVSDIGQDDHVLPFAVSALDLRGRAVRLGPSLDIILSQHNYPAPVARLVGEAAALTVLLGSALKSQGRFQLQTRSDGVVSMLVVDFEAPDKLRAVARFDETRLQDAVDAGRMSPAALLGKGHLAMTIETGLESSRYQGVVSLDGQGLEEAAHQYFRQSEQIPTMIRLAVGENLSGSGHDWRAGGLMVQFLPHSIERQKQADLHPGDAPAGASGQQDVFQEDEAWHEAQALIATVEDHELIDPLLSSERLLYRLFHQSGVSVFDAQSVRHQCRCSQERMEGLLRSFSREERRDMIGENGRIGVTCEFCSVHRDFDPLEFDPLDFDGA
jgi:molecular chaperone Hsp33